MMQTYKRLPVDVRARRGLPRSTTPRARQYLDFLAGIAVCNTGHCHPARRRGDPRAGGPARCTSPTSTTTSLPARLAQRLAESFEPGARVFLCNSGAEANEAMIKLARKHRRGGEIVVLEGAFHGRTMGALSATPQPDKQEPFAPLVPGFVAVPRDDPDALDGRCRRADRGGDARADPGRDRHLADLRAHAARGARGLRPHRARC